MTAKLLTCVAAVLLVGCVSQPAGEDPSRADSVWFSATRSGGYIGEYQNLVFLNNGTVLIKKDQTATSTTAPKRIVLDSQQQEKIAEQVKAAHLDVSVTIPPIGADQPLYTFISGGSSVEAAEGQIPENLAPLVSTVNTLLAQN